MFFLIAVRTPKLTSGRKHSDEKVLNQKTSNFKRTSEITQFNSFSSYFSDGETQYMGEVTITLALFYSFSLVKLYQHEWVWLRTGVSSTEEKEEDCIKHEDVDAQMAKLVSN